MKIALDYDQTYTLDPTLWDGFIDRARENGHDIRVVTARDERLDRTAKIAALEAHVQVIYCRGVAKRWFCTHFVPDFVPDVWIDDKPQAIDNNSPGAVEWLAEWRATRDEGPNYPA
jgi:hypothetical protein